MCSLARLRVRAKSTLEQVAHLIHTRASSDATGCAVCRNSPFDNFFKFFKNKKTQTIPKIMLQLLKNHHYKRGAEALLPTNQLVLNL